MSRVSLASIREEGRKKALGEVMLVAANVTIAQAGGWQFTRYPFSDGKRKCHQSLNSERIGSLEADTFAELAALAAAEVLK